MIAATIFHTMADASSAASVMRDFVTPVVQALCVAASLVCAFFLTSGGYHYMTSSGNPENLDHAKRTIRNALIGLITVLAAAVLTTILTHAYAGSSQAINSNLPTLVPLKPQAVSNGLVDVIIKAVTGFLNNIIQSIAEPFLKALTYFTTSTPLMADNSAVFNLWLVVAGMTDVIFVLVVALLGFHIMGASTFGFDEIEFKHLLPRLALIFMLVNCSIFVIDGVIELSNAMIHAINAAGGSTTSVWDVLTTVVKQSAGAGAASLLIMIAFLIFTFILLVYYVGRLVALFIGAVLSPLVLVLWLIPGFRDFTEAAAKVYAITIFVLFVHVVILQLAASLLAGMVIGSPDQAPDALMAMIVGVATLIALLKTQSVMNQFAYAAVAPRYARKLGGQLITVASLIGGKGLSTAKKVRGRGQKNDDEATDGNSSSPRGGRKYPQLAFAGAGAPYAQPSNRNPYDEAFGARDNAHPKNRKKATTTGETAPAPDMPGTRKATQKRKNKEEAI